MQAIAIDKKSLPPNHPEIATDLHNLAVLYYSQGRYGEAEPLFLQAIEICQRSLGENNPNRVKFEQNFALFLDARNDGESVEYRGVAGVSSRSGNIGANDSNHGEIRG